MGRPWLHTGGTVPAARGGVPSGDPRPLLLQAALRSGPTGKEEETLDEETAYGLRVSLERAPRLLGHHRALRRNQVE